MNKIKIDPNDPTTYVISKLNEKKYTRITHTHTKKYGMSVEDYCKKFNLNRQDIVCTKLRERLSWTLENCINTYGEIEGNKKWKEYCDKQAHSNSFEYKNQKHGMTREQYDNYNRSRASTKNNFIKRHGELEGNKKWNEYCERQAYAGVSLQYFIDMYGELEGKKIYLGVCEKKKHTLEVFINRYGTKEGNKRYNSWLETKHVFFSKISQELFNSLKINKNHKIYYATYNKEFSIYNENIKQVHFYDFINLTTKRGIEFNGDYFHGNPKKFKPDDYPNPFAKDLSCKRIWEYDNIKINCAKDVKDIDILTIWESDYLSDKNIVIEKCNKFIYEQ